MVKGKQQRRRDRKRADPSVPPVVAQVAVVSVTAGTDEVTVLFASQVVISPTSLPLTWTFGTSARLIVGIASSTGLSYVFQLNGSVASTQVFAMPGLDPAARTPTGGYVASAAGVLV